MNESTMNPVTTGWYHIPGYNGYQINKHTGDVRSFKNYKADPYHIMRVDKNGYITVSSDTDGRKRIKPSKLYELTFNGNTPPEIATDAIYMGGRSPLAKKAEIPNTNGFFQHL